MALLKLGTKLLKLSSHRTLLEGAVDVEQNFFVTEWLGDVVKSPGTHRFHGAFDAAEGGNQQDRRVRIDLSQLSDQLRSLHAGHHQIRQCQIEARGAVLLKRRSAGANAFALL